MSVIFISYRRSDSPDVTGRIYDRLLNKYTEKQVFKDVDSIPMGISFPLHIKQMLGKSRAVLVIIGPNWLDAQDEHGNLRLEHPDDYVRLEIEIALRAAVPVIPVLVSRAEMPSSSDLPKSIRSLARRNGMSIRPDPDFNNDIARLISELDKLEKLVVAKPGKPPSGKFPALRSAIGKRVAAISTELSPSIPPAAVEESATVDRRKRRPAAEQTPELGARPSRSRFGLRLAGLGLLIACMMGLWASGMFRRPTPKEGSPAQPTAEADSGDTSATKEAFESFVQTFLPHRSGSGSDYDPTGGVQFVHFVPAGPRVVLRFNNKERKDFFAQVYELASGKAITPPLRHDETVRDAVFSPDGKRVVTLSGGEYHSDTARVWDAVTGEALTLLHKQKYGLDHAAFSPDSRQVVTTGEYEVQVWDEGTSKREIVLTSKEALIFNYGFSRFSPDGKRVATSETAFLPGKKNFIVHIWDAATCQKVAPPLEHEDSAYHACFSPDSKRIVTTSKNTARVWDASTGKEVVPPLQHKESVWRAVFSPNGKRIVTACQDTTAQVWDAMTGKALSPPLKHQKAVEYASFSPDCKQVVTCSLDMTAQIWDAGTGAPATPPLKHDDHDGRVRRATFSPDGKQVVTVSYGDTWRLWDAKTGQELNKLAASPQ